MVRGGPMFSSILQPRSAANRGPRGAGAFSVSSHGNVGKRKKQPRLSSCA